DALFGRGGGRVLRRANSSNQEKDKSEANKSGHDSGLLVAVSLLREGPFVLLANAGRSACCGNPSRSRARRTIGNHESVSLVARPALRRGKARGILLLLDFCGDPRGLPFHAQRAGFRSSA